MSDTVRCAECGAGTFGHERDCSRNPHNPRYDNLFEQPAVVLDPNTDAAKVIQALISERDALALQLQAAQDALAQVVAENTANVAALAEAEQKARGEEQARWHEIIGILRLRYEVAAPISGGPGYINRLSALDDVLALAPEPANG